MPMTFLTVMSLGSTAVQILVSHIWCTLVKHIQVFVVATGQRDETVPSTVMSVVSTIEKPG